MRAAILTEKGGTPEAGEFRDPAPDDDAAVVQVLAAGLNPIDLILATGLMPARLPELPAVVGLEGVGETADGRRVYFGFSQPPFGSMAERTLVDEGELVEIPEGVADGLALAFGIAGTAAWLSLGWRGGLTEGETVLVLGSSSIVGQIAVQGAKLMGAGRVVAASRHEADLERSLAHGADATVQLTGDDVTDRMRDAAGGGGYDLIIDPLWGPPAAAALECVAAGGRLVQIGNAAAPTAELPARFIRNQLAEIRGHSNFTAPREERTKAFREMCEHAAAGDLEVPVETVPLEDIADAWQRQADGPRAKLVIDPRG